MAITANTTIRSLWPIGPVLLPPVGTAVQRRPVVNLSLAVNYAISGYEVWSYHALNLAAHLLTALLLFGVVRRTLALPRIGPICRMGLESDSHAGGQMGAQPTAMDRNSGKSPARQAGPTGQAGPTNRFDAAATSLALVVALLWAVHPLLTEAVTYVVQRTEVLAGLFYLLTLYCMIRGEGSTRGRGWYAMAVAACALAMGSKETAICRAAGSAVVRPSVSQPLVGRGISSPLGVVRRLGGHLGRGARHASAGLRGAAVFTISRNAYAGRVIGERCRPIDYTLCQFGVIAHYLRLCFWPHRLVIDYGYYAPPTVWQIAPYAALIGGLLAATLAAFRYQPWLGFLGVWFFAVLAPSSSVVPLFQQVAAEKRMYLPLAAAVTAVVIGGYLAAHRLIAGGVVSARAAKITGTCLIGSVVAVLGTLTFQRNATYRDELSLWRDAADKMPNNAPTTTTLA